MPFCRQCSKEIQPPDARFCWRCGSTVYAGTPRPLLKFPDESRNGWIKGVFCLLAMVWLAWLWALTLAIGVQWLCDWAWDA